MSDEWQGQMNKIWTVDEKNFVRRRNFFQLRTKFFSSADEIQMNCATDFTKPHTVPHFSPSGSAMNSVFHTFLKSVQKIFP